MTRGVVQSCMPADERGKTTIQLMCEFRPWLYCLVVFFAAISTSYDRSLTMSTADFDAEAASSSGSKVDGSDTLESWYWQYNAADAHIHIGHAVVQSLQSNELDYDQIENEVQRLVSTTRVIEGFCGKCHHLLDHWPSNPPIFPTCIVARAFHTLDDRKASLAISYHFDG